MERPTVPWQESVKHFSKTELLQTYCKVREVSASCTHHTCRTYKWCVLSKNRDTFKHQGWLGILASSRKENVHFLSNEASETSKSFRKAEAILMKLLIADKQWASCSSLEKMTSKCKMGVIRNHCCAPTKHIHKSSSSSIPSRMRNSTSSHVWSIVLNELKIGRKRKKYWWTFQTCWTSIIV